MSSSAKRKKPNGSQIYNSLIKQPTEEAQIAAVYKENLYFSREEDILIVITGRHNEKLYTFTAYENKGLKDNKKLYTGIIDRESLNRDYVSHR